MTFGAYRTVKSFVNNCYGSVIIEPVRRDQAPARFQGIAECRLRARRLRPRVNHLGGDGRVFRPRGNQSPPHQRQLADGFLWMLANNWNGLRWSDVVAWSPLFFA